MVRTHRHAARLSAVVLAALLAASACSQETDSSSAQSPASTPPETTSSAPAPAPKRWPFTGTKAASLPDRRAVVVKIENTDNGEPQVGLGAADLVVEQLVEGGLTRLAAFYYSSLPAEVGPVRSLRGTDIGIVKPTRGLLVASGGSPKTMRRVREARVVTATEGAAGYYRVIDRPSPYNLFMNLRKLAKDKIAGPRPRPYLPWGSATKLGGGKRAKNVTASFTSGTSTRWAWNGNVYRQSDSHAAAGQEFRPDNVLVLQVRQVDAGYTDAAGNPVPESVLAGKGPATLFHGGRAYEGAWTKTSVTAPLRLVTARGKPMPVPPGHTWIELVPRAGGAVSFSR